MVDNAPSTIIGPSILINGNLQGDEDLTVLGRVEGSLTLTKTLNVEESGIVKADISVRNAIISGVVVGNISASDSVEITEAGRMVGDIKAPRVIIVDGARFKGAVDMGDLEAARPTGPLPARTTTDRTAMTRTIGARATTTPAAGAKQRPTPPPPTKKVEEAPRKAAAPAPATAPVIAGKKQIKKKVVVKKKD